MKKDFFRAILVLAFVVVLFAATTEVNAPVIGAVPSQGQSMLVVDNASEDVEVLRPSQVTDTAPEQADEPVQTLVPETKLPQDETHFEQGSDQPEEPGPILEPTEFPSAEAKPAVPTIESSEDPVENSVEPDKNDESGIEEPSLDDSIADQTDSEIEAPETYIRPNGDVFIIDEDGNEVLIDHLETELVFNEYGNVSVVLPDRGYITVGLWFNDGTIVPCYPATDEQGPAIIQDEAGTIYMDGVGIKGENSTFLQRLFSSLSQWGLADKVFANGMTYEVIDGDHFDLMVDGTTILLSAPSTMEDVGFLNVVNQLMAIA